MCIYNRSHCKDTTAAEAIKNIDVAKAADDRAKQLISIIMRLISLTGFTLENRLELTHNKTGRKYR